MASGRIQAQTSHILSPSHQRYPISSDKGVRLLTKIPPPRAAWIQAAPRENDEPLVLGLLHDSIHLTDCVRQLRVRLQRVEKDFDLTSKC
jgi:hypothetical protein